MLFLIPSRQEEGGLMDWEAAEGIPRGIILLFGGGFALARAGLALNFIGVFIVTLATYYLGVAVFGIIELSVFPDWATSR
ncbi:MAG: hypothetical protein H6556_07665 [Lewinellaceae bacterium]|nr:hypothetical protein [Lewinellaceae bacterium]